MTHSESPKRTEVRRSQRRHSRVKSTLAVTTSVLLIAIAISAYFVLAGQTSSHAEAEALAAEEAAQTQARPIAASERLVAQPLELTRPATITIAAVGDMIFDRQVARLIETKGGEAPLAGVAALLARADLAIGNLESPLSERGSFDASKSVNFRGDPRGVEGLAAAGFDILSIANNHTMDYGRDALEDTISTLDAAGIAHAGAGMDRAAAWEPAVVQVENATVAYFAFSHILPPGFIATDTRAGLAAARVDMNKMADAVAAAKESYDYVLVSYHWGIEYVDDANAEQIRDARATIDAGADMVLAHHPHVIQGIEIYNGGLIAYSLGDFVFDHFSRKTGEAFVLEAELGPNGITHIEATPVYLDGYGAPDVVTGSEAQVILERLAKISAKHGTEIAIEGDMAKVIQ